MDQISNLLSANHTYLLFENTLPTNQHEPAWLFSDPIAEIHTNRPEQVAAALEQVDSYRRQGYYLAGYIAYEAAYALQPSLHRLAADAYAQPLVQFFVFRDVLRPSVAAISSALLKGMESPPFLTALSCSESEHLYRDQLQAIHGLIRAGDTYQVNHTVRMQFDLEGRILDLYQLLRQRQPVAYSALLNLPNRTILSLSPELFIEKRGTSLTCKPMKGTASRGETEMEDQAILAAMQSDPKIHAENVMIVDLMRNDIGHIAKAGSVHVSQLFAIQSYPTVFQMISTIHGEVDATLPFAKLMAGLFPCGSITGAPKLRTMEIIHELESTPRGIYTGAIGFITPDNDCVFNVAIRTLDFPGNSQSGEFGVGGGIIHDSDSNAEWQELHLKTQFLIGVNHDFQLIETFRYCHTSREIPRLAHHLDRLAHSADCFGFRHDRDGIHQRIMSYTREQAFNSGQKIRLLLNAEGTLTLSSEPLDGPAADLTASLAQLASPNSPASARRAEDALPSIIIAPETIDQHNRFRQHKTTRRALYNRAYATASQQGHYDILFYNHSGHLAEASRHNVIIRLDGQLITPPLSDGALPGIMRSSLLQEPQLAIIERSISRQDLYRADALFLCNAVRGVIACELIMGSDREFDWMSTRKA